MEDRPDIGLDSYDRLFPNQDTLPQGGFGNLIALPLQRGPRDQGNSVFIDDELVPWADQWAFLSGLRRIARVEVEARMPTMDKARSWLQEYGQIWEEEAPTIARKRGN